MSITGSHDDSLNTRVFTYVYLYLCENAGFPVDNDTQLPIVLQVEYNCIIIIEVVKRLSNMANAEADNQNIELLQSNFRTHNFKVQVGEVKLSCEIIVMHDSLFLWIGDCNEGKLNDISFAFLSNYEVSPIATKLMGSLDDTTSANIAKRLTKKCGKPIYVSFNVAVNHSTLLAIERSIHEELRKHPHIIV